MKRHRSTFSVTINVLFIVMGNVYFGYSLAYYGISQDTIVYLLGYQDAKYKEEIDGAINTLLPVGAGIGAFFSGKLAHKFFYRNTFMLCDVFGLINAVASLFMNYWSITITRFIYGIVVGINSALSPQYVRSITPTPLGGIMGTCCQVAFLFGLTVAFILSWVCLKNKPDTFIPDKDYGIYGFNQWRILFGFPAITCIVRLFAMTFIYTRETPQEYLRDGKREQAKETLAVTYRDSRVWEVLEELENEKAIGSGKEMTYSQLLKPDYIKPFIVCNGISFITQWCGINAINFYSVTIFSGVSNGNFDIINMLTVADGVIGMTVALFSGIIIGRQGRRFMLLAGNGVCAVSLVGLAILYYLVDNGNSSYYLQVTIVILLFVFIIAYSMSLGPVFWVYIAEVLPPKGIGLVVLQNWFSLALLTYFLPIIVGRTGISICFAIFAGVSFLGEIFMWYKLKETKNMSKIQIFQMYSRYKVPGGKFPGSKTIAPLNYYSMSDTLSNSITATNQ